MKNESLILVIRHCDEYFYCIMKSPIDSVVKNQEMKKKAFKSKRKLEIPITKLQRKKKKRDINQREMEGRGAGPFENHVSEVFLSSPRAKFSRQTRNLIVKVEGKFDLTVCR